MGRTLWKEAPAPLIESDVSLAISLHLRFQVMHTAHLVPSLQFIASMIPVVEHDMQQVSIAASQELFAEANELTGDFPIGFIRS